MPITRISLYDVGRFAELDLELGGRMVGITGRNGSGKSTILRSIAFAFTGDTGCLGRKDAARIGRTATDQPYVVMNFTTHAGKPAHVCRWLPIDKKAGRHKLCASERTLSTADSVEGWMERELGTTMSAARELLFTDQGRLTDVISAPAAKRADSFQRAFGLHAAARAYSAAVDHLSGLPGPPEPAALGMYRGRVAELTAQVTACSQELLDLSPVSDDDAAAARAVVHAHERRRDLAPAARRLRNEIEELNNRLLRDPVPAVPPEEIETVRVLSGAAARYEAWRAERTEVERRISALESSLADRQPGPDPGAAPEPDPELVELRTKSITLNYVAYVSTEIDNKCPVCGGPFVPGADTRAEAERCGRLLSEAEGRYNRDLEIHADRIKAHAAATERARGVRARIAELRGQLREPPTDPGVSADEIRNLSADIARRADAHRADAEARRSAVRDLENRTRTLAELESGLPDEVPERALESARSTIAAYNEVCDRRRSLEARAAVLRNSLESARKELASLEGAARAADVLREHRERVGAVIDVLHRDAAPSVAAAAALNALTDDVNKKLAQIGADYRAAVTPDGEIECTFGDGSPRRRAAVLSVGQQMTLALAWRLSVVDRYCPRAGTMCLDEPTAGLDEERILALRSALDVWKDVEDGPQVIVVTHDRRLSGCFDVNIEL